jgi:glucose/arabinose dehydrogenase/PKD repeat protein
MRICVAAALAIAAVMAITAPARATTYPAGFEERTVASGLTQPTTVAWVPDGRMFIAEKDGRVRVVMPNGTLSPTPVLDISSHVYSVADRGMLGMAADSDFANNHYLYLLYVYQPAGASGNGARTSRLTRVTVNNDNTASAEVTLLGTVGTPPCPPPANNIDCIPADSDSHSIGTVRSDTDGTLFVGNGDGSDWSRVDPQALRTYDETSLSGKIMHIDRNGNGLPGHPFCPGETDLTKVCTKLYAKGLRNPYRFHLRPGTGPAIADVGWEEWEEMNLATGPGKNFGWPCYEGMGHTSGYRDLAGCASIYATEGTPQAVTPPNFSYSHTQFPTQQAAIVGGPVYPAGGPYPSDYAGDVFYGDYVHGFMNRLKLNASGQVISDTPFASNGPPWVDISLGPNGNIYFADYGDGNTATGAIRQIVYTPTNGSPVARASADRTSGGVPLAVQFTGSGSTDPNNDPLTYDWDFGDGTAHSAAANPSHTYTTAGTYTAVLTVSDGRGGVSTANVLINADNDPPVPTINAPADGSIYRIGQTVQLDGSASDVQDGSLPGSALAWHVSLIHLTHHHDLADFTGNTPSFQAATDHDADAHYRITLTATDTKGATGQKTIDIYPQAVNLTLGSSPTGAPMTYGGTTQNAPFTRSAAVDFNANIAAGPSFVSGGTTYEFASWSDGKPRSHDIVIPSSDLSLTATYRPQVWFEGESMTITTADSTAVRVIAEGNTSGGNTMGYRKSPSSAQEQYTTQGYSDAMILRMRADTCQGPPTATVTIDNQPARNIDVPDTAYTDYSLPLTAQSGGTPGTHTVKVEFLNNLVNSTCDRNIYLDKITLHQADNQPLGGYARPKAATPLAAPLVPAYNPCSAANRVHATPLSFNSCNPPALASANLTTGTPDSNGAEANMTGSYRATVCEGGPCGTGDVLLAFNATDVRCKAGTAPCAPANTASGADYTGELKVTSSLRITDKLNGGTGTAAMATGVDTPFPFTALCTETTDPSTGSTCAASTSANAVVPGSVASGARSIWELGDVDVFDGGPDGDVDTPAGNTLFLTQGLFVP